MPGESQRMPSSEADPSVFTTEQLLRQAKAERDYVDGQIQVIATRLDGMDKATKVLHETVTRVPTDIQVAVGHLLSVLDERFNSVAIQFKERDTRQERESKDNKVAVDAAFAAADKAADERNKSNTLAISKSEASTAETINKLAELFKSADDARAAQITDLKERLVSIESRKEGAQENRTASSATANLLIGVLGVIVAVLVLGVAIYAATH